MFVPMFMLPQVFQFYVNAVVSTKRLRKFFSAAEIEDKDDGRNLERVNRLDSEHSHYPKRGGKGEGAVSLDASSFKLAFVKGWFRITDFNKQVTKF